MRKENTKSKQECSVFGFPLKSKEEGGQGLLEGQFESVQIRVILGDQGQEEGQDQGEGPCGAEEVSVVREHSEEHPELVPELVPVLALDEVVNCLKFPCISCAGAPKAMGYLL